MPNGTLTIIEPPASQLVEFPGEAQGTNVAESIFRHAKIIALATIAGLAAALIFTALQTPLYSASSSLQLEQQTTKVVGDDENAAELGDAKRQLNTQVALLGSRVLAGKVAQSLGLVGNSDFYRAMGRPVPSDKSSQSGRTAHDRAANILASNVDVDLLRDARVATITFTSPSPKLSATIANAYGEGLIALNIERRFASSEYARKYLDGELVKTRAQLEGSQRALNQYARSAGLINIGDAKREAGGAANTVTQSSLLQLNQALSDARARRIDAEQRARTAASASVLNIPEVVNNSAVQRLLTDRAAEEVKLAETQQRYTSEHPSSATGTARSEKIDEQLNAIAAGVRNSLQMQYRAARGEEAALASQVASLKAQSLNEQDKSVRYNMLLREVDTNQSMYDLLLQRQREVGTSAGVTPNNISILDRATIPTSPSSPKPVINAIAGTLIGFILGLGFAFFREKTDGRIRNSADVQRSLKLPNLARIPSIRGMRHDRLLATLEDPGSELGNHYAALRTSLQFSTRKGLPKVFAITSIGEGEGKSTTAVALARSLSGAGKNVLLIEADLRHAAVSELMGIGDHPGLSNLLIGQGALQSYVQSTQFEHFDVLPSGHKPPNPTDILDPDLLRDILEDAAQHYDCVIVDGPPAAELGDASLIAAAARNIVLVVSARSNHHGRSSATIDRLKATGARILGVVLTNTPEERLRGYPYPQFARRMLHYRATPAEAA